MADPTFGLSQYQHLFLSPNYQLQLFAPTTRTASRRVLRCPVRGLHYLKDVGLNRFAVCSKSNLESRTEITVNRSNGSRSGSEECPRIALVLTGFSWSVLIASAVGSMTTSISRRSASCFTLSIVASNRIAPMTLSPRKSRRGHDSHAHLMHELEHLRVAAIGAVRNSILAQGITQSSWPSAARSGVFLGLGCLSGKGIASEGSLAYH